MTRGIVHLAADWQQVFCRAGGPENADHCLGADSDYNAEVNVSSEQSASPEALEETRQGIRLLVGEIARLARMDLEPGEFLGEFLGRVVSALAAVGGAVWVVQEGLPLPGMDLGPPGRNPALPGRGLALPGRDLALHGRGLALQCQVNLERTGIGKSGEEGQIGHGRLLESVCSDAKGILVPPYSPSAGPPGENATSATGAVVNAASVSGASANATSANGQAAGNPTDYLLVLAPLRTDLETVGVLEIFQRPDTTPQSQRGYLRFALQMCEVAGDFFRSRQLRSLADRQAFWSRLEEFTRAVHASLEVRPAAYTIANEGRRLIECDRVSVAVSHGRKCTIEAVSGQDVFEKRSNTVRLLTKLAEMAAGTREPIWYTGDTREMAPQVEEVIQEYVDQSQSKVVGVLPLLRPRAAGDGQEADRETTPEPEPVVAVLIVERIEDCRVPEGMRQRIDFVCRHGGSALANAWEHQNLFLMPVWKSLGKTKWVVKARTLPKTLLVLAVAIVLLGVLLCWPASFEMEAGGTLEPVLRRNVFAGLDGRVEEVFVNHGERVYRHAILGAKGTAVPGPLRARFQDDPKDQAGELTLLVVPEGTCSFVEAGVKPGDTVRARLPAGGQGETEWTELRIGQVVDARTLRLKSGPAGPVDGPVEIEIWRISPLARLRSTELEMDAAGVTGRQTTIREQMHTIQRLLLEERELSVEQQNRLSGQLAELEEELQSLDQKLGLYKRKQQELWVTAPADGVVMTWELRDRLIGRPVRRGQFLMQVADPEGPWQLELRMPEDQVGHVLQSQRELGEQLRVTYILATDPGRERTGRVVEVHRAAEVHGQEGSTVLVKVTLDEDLAPVEEEQLAAYRQAGAELTARVHCGRRSLGYVLFHDLIGFIQSRILFRL
jgi:hypothetical protein